MNTQSRQTPYDDDYGTCLETHATLVIHPGVLSRGEITAQLQIKPTPMLAVDEVVLDVMGRPRVEPPGVWSLSSEGQVYSLDVRRHLDWLIARLEPLSNRLRELQTVDGLQMSVVCTWYSKYGEGGPTIWPEQMLPLAEMNLECSFDIHFFPDEEE